MKKSDPNRGEEQLTEVRRSQNCQKGGEGRLGEDRRRDGSARQRRTSLEMESRHRKVGHASTLAYTRWRVELGQSEKSDAWPSVDDCLRGFRRRVDRPHAPRNLRSLAGKVTGGEEIRLQWRW